MSEKGEKSVSPAQVLLSAFEFFKTDKLPLDGLLRVGTMANSPSDEVTQRVLNGLVQEGMLNWEKDKDGKVWFKVPKVDKSKLQ